MLSVKYKRSIDAQCHCQILHDSPTVCRSSERCKRHTTPALDLLQQSALSLESKYGLHMAEVLQASQ